MMMDFDEGLRKANSLLKAGKNHVLIERRGTTLYLRATLPPKLGSNHDKVYRQRIALGATANPAGLQFAERKAKLLAAQLDNQKFDWADWIGEQELQRRQERELKTVEVWLKEFELELRQAHQITDTTWRTDYLACFKRLPKEEPLTAELLIAAVQQTEPHSRQRKRFCDHLNALAEFAGLEGREKIKILTGKYSPRVVNPKHLPSDELITIWRDSIKNKAWQWGFGVLAAYGLRPHELLRATWEDFPIARIPANTKTGSRFVLPFYPEWAQDWKLGEVILPNLDLNYSNEKLSNKVSAWFSNNKLLWQVDGKPQKFTALYLRHSYARRCFEFCLPPDWAAGLMGHSVKVHLETYRMWIEENTYLKVYQSILSRPGRPLPPGVTALTYR